MNLLSGKQDIQDSHMQAHCRHELDMDASRNSFIQLVLSHANSLHDHKNRHHALIDVLYRMFIDNYRQLNRGVI